MLLGGKEGVGNDERSLEKMRMQLIFVMGSFRDANLGTCFNF